MAIPFRVCNSPKECPVTTHATESDVLAQTLERHHASFSEDRHHLPSMGSQEFNGSLTLNRTISLLHRGDSRLIEPARPQT
jgi:hypothetical protein